MKSESGVRGGCVLRQTLEIELVCTGENSYQERDRSTSCVMSLVKLFI
jgi:hypothetical protein